MNVPFSGGCRLITFKKLPLIVLNSALETASSMLHLQMPMKMNAVVAIQDSVSTVSQSTATLAIDLPKASLVLPEVPWQFTTHSLVLSHLTCATLAAGLVTRL